MLRVVNHHLSYMEGLDCMELEGDILNPRLCNKCLKSSV